MKTFVKKVAVVLASAIMLGSLTGCDSNKWKEEAASALPAAFDDASIGTFYAQGEVFTYPLKVKDMLDGGYKYPKDIKDIDDETLDYNWSTGALELGSKSNSKKVVEIKAINIDKETLNLKECWIEKLSMNKNSGNIMLPGGITIGQEFSSKEEFEQAIPKAFLAKAPTEDDSIFNYKASFVSKEKYVCTMNLQLKESGTSKFSLYQIIFESEYYFESGYFLDSEVKAIMNKDFEEYSKLFDDDPEAFAKDWRETSLRNVLYLYGFTPDKLTDEQYAKMDAYFSTIMKDVKWEFTDNGEDISVTFSYPDIIDTVLEDAFNAALESYTKTDVTVDDMKVDQDLINAFIDNICNSDKEITLKTDGKLTFKKIEGETISSDDFSDLTISMFGLYEPILSIREDDTTSTTTES
ncbi:MAG: hypothetical protein IKG93_06615 [Clostridiales bacterium]|nr:hypothetical protein [Clostridiales bacterium]